MDREFYLWLQELIKDLQLPVWPLENKISRQNAKTIIANALYLDPEDPDLLEKASLKLNQILVGQEEAPSIPQNLEELVRDYEEHREILEKQREKLLKRTYPTLSDQIRKALQDKYAEELRKQLLESEKQLPEKERVLTQNPRRAKTISQQIADELASRLPQTAREEGPGALLENEYQKVLKEAQPEIKQVLEKAGLREPERIVGIFINQTAKQNLPFAQKIAATPRALIEEVSVLPPREIKPEELVLTKDIAAKLATEPEGVCFLPLYSIHPKVASSLMQRIIFTPPAMVLKIAASELSPEWQEMIKKGIFIEDYEASIKRLKELGLSENHSLIIALREKRDRLLEIQKIKIVREDGTFYFKDKPAVSILKGYCNFPKLTGRHQVFDERIKNWLPSLSPSPILGKLRQGLNNLGFITRFFEKIELGPGKSVIRFTLPDRFVKAFTFGKFESFGAIRTIIYQKTIGRAVTYLAQTAVGKAIKEGVKKAATWVAARLGIEIGALAAGAAAAPETLGISLLVAAVVDLGIEVAKKIWDALKSIIREPEKALGLIAAGIIVSIILPMPIALIAVVPILIGGLGLVSFGVSGAGAIASGLAARTTAFFLALTLAPITAPIATLIIAVISILAAFTFFIVITTAGAFILPVGPTEMIPGPPPPENPPVIPPPSGLTFRWPVDSPMTCSSNYGYRILENKCDYHEGIDIPADYGAPVYAVAKGIVYDLNFNPGYGNYIVIKHNGLYSFYAHLRGFNVFKGDDVNTSTIIGYVGSSGYSTGPHLHFGFSSCGTVPTCFNDGKYTPDPCNYLGSANPACSSDCGYRDRNKGCPNL